MRPTTATSRRGFTLIELIIVMVIMAIFATMALPRIFGNNDRRFQQTADEVADLLMMYAQRNTLGARPIGLMQDTQRHRLALMTLEVDEESLDKQSYWALDRNIKPVLLPDDVVIFDVHADGESVDISQWPFQSEPGQPRVSLAIILQGPSGIITIALAAHALAPIQTYSKEYAQWLGGPIDLDAAGRDREDW